MNLYLMQTQYLDLNNAIKLIIAASIIVLTTLFLIEIYRHVNTLTQYCRSDQSAHALVTYMNNVTQTCNNTQIRNDGGDESIAFWEKHN